ncbi:MAG: hypothetical protein ACU85V_12875 [Gammaproteobacteria bacterium]
MTVPQRPAAILLMVLAWGLAAVPAPACDTDADCGTGGTCIKREKRARGVCYGGSFDAPSAETTPPANTVPLPVTGERRERARAWLGDPEANIRENLGDREIGAACMVNQDCPAGSECVIAGFEGRCVSQ